MKALTKANRALLAQALTDGMERWSCHVDTYDLGRDGWKVRALFNPELYELAFAERARMRMYLEWPVPGHSWFFEFGEYRRQAAADVISAKIGLPIDKDRAVVLLDQMREAFCWKDTLKDEIDDRASVLAGRMGSWITFRVGPGYARDRLFVRFESCFADDLDYLAGEIRNDLLPASPAELRRLVGY
jgi:hypothetical protein